MTKSTMNVIRGIGIGVAVGTTVGLLSNSVKSGNKKSMKRTVGRAMRSVGDFVEGLQYMMR